MFWSTIYVVKFGIVFLVILNTVLAHALILSMRNCKDDFQWTHALQGKLINKIINAWTFLENNEIKDRNTDYMAMYGWGDVTFGCNNVITWYVVTM